MTKIRVDAEKILKGLARIRNGKDISDTMSNVDNLKVYIENQMLLQKGSHDISADIKRFAMIAKRFSKADMRQALAGAFRNGDYIALTNGYYAIALKDKDKKISAIMAKTEEPLNILSVMDPFNVELEDIELDGKEVIAKRKIYKSALVGLRGRERSVKEKELCKMKLGDNFYNVEYIYEIIKLLGDKGLKFCTNKSGSGLLIEDKNDNKALLLKIRVDKNE